MLENIDLQQVLVLDIETVPQYPAFKELPAEYQQLWDQKTRFQRRDGETAAEFYSRAGILAEFGKIICISVGIFSKKTETLSLRVKSFYGDDEKEVIQSFIDLLNKQSDSLILCAHNGKEFDFPYLCRRMLINGLQIPVQLNIHGKKPWEIMHLDTMDLWKFGDYKNYTSLNLLAAVFNIPSPKDDIDGSMVHKVYWEDNDLERIRIYCEKDVITTAQILLKFKSLAALSTDQITIVER
ncbi:MAG: 3'-5' exonuclease [Sphingobacteriales bacterium 17-39-43]|jgi:DNA polymerase elongation subunit (family B)|uniref:3'-5' exonuclease n=1 Tax=Daejeonella sp. TaxID=2805397 RepID=UPI000BCC00C4|nr:3'-5' exonuclease [Daejeonella sp.]OYX98670.1 MAG: 3'-5' exonuclease [Sphingobacteriia bacterium 35-40-5]OYZ33152.1 MAG: 3'-5' exonuclease [Sphingobacteriales bacterium 16-39-50]OYZ55964.1 MAG: 3'-5' exonuclease [Sphingobacteriales bacterium 24-40-4]OZA26561.1 MAG: 3'-5' exonuclease [Sphingobacteriales bacterium 17-39-43]HQS05110.1 3'-5' exonuclease [Daejeonella sp.]